MLNGSDGIDYVSGGGGFDTIDGGLGNDELSGRIDRNNYSVEPRIIYCTVH